MKEFQEYDARDQLKRAPEPFRSQPRYVLALRLGATTGLVGALAFAEFLVGVLRRLTTQRQGGRAAAPRAPQV